MPTTTLLVRNIDAEVVKRLKLAASARGWTLAVYIAHLVELHDRVRGLVDDSYKDTEDLYVVLAFLNMETKAR